MYLFSLDGSGVDCSGGRDRYLLNSRIAQVKEIKDFFQCCQLNINSPHFMIQQGKRQAVDPCRP